MYKIVLFFFFTLFTASGFSQTASEESVLFVKDNKHDFGKIVQGKPVNYIFELKNQGNEAVSISNVKASCGCTTPEWNKEVIKPGETTKIKVGFNAAEEGKFNRTVLVLLNNNQNKTLFISGEVAGMPATPAPENQSILLLKKINN